MENCACFLVLLLHATALVRSALSVGVAIGGGGGGNLWLGEGNSPPGDPFGRTGSPYAALQAWKSAITDDPSGILSTWVGSDVCSYKGVFCADSQDLLGNPTGRIVAAIDLNHGNLQGSLVGELSYLTDLSILHLNSNRFSGTIPFSLRDLSSLTELDLSNNRFSGSFPTAILYIPNLLYLDLRFNYFSGPLPMELFNKKLDAIFLNNNLFDGEIPENLASSPASVMNFANNKLSGNIPFTFSYVGVKEILFLNNKLTGCVPEGIGLWTDLQVLDVSSNSLSGHLPDSLTCLSGIEVLNFANNKLSGELPELLCSLRNLINLTVSANFFSGFNQDCERLTFRDVGFDFSFNCIPGKGVQRPPPECSSNPGDGLSCLRNPLTKPLVCGSIVGGLETAAATPSP